MPGRSYDLVRQTPGGNPGDGSLNGILRVQANAGVSTAISKTLLEAGTDGGDILDLTGGNLEIHSPNGTLAINAPAFLRSTVTGFDDKGTAGYGVAPIYGLDKRLGVTAADASAKTLYTTTAANQLYLVVARLFGVSGTNLSATYLVKWTENGSVQTATLTLSGAPSLYVSTSLIQPDSGTAITVQLTALSGTSPVVNVAAIVMQAD